MIGAIATALIARGLPEKAAKPLIFAGLAIAILVLSLGLKCAYDRSVIRNHTNAQEAATAKADRKADATAADQRRVDDARLSQETQQLEKAQTNATTDTDRRLAKHRCLRAQQEARRLGKQPPTCG